MKEIGKNFIEKVVEFYSEEWKRLGMVNPTCFVGMADGKFKSIYLSMPLSSYEKIMQSIVKDKKVVNVAITYMVTMVHKITKERKGMAVIQFFNPTVADNVFTQTMENGQLVLKSFSKGTLPSFVLKNPWTMTGETKDCVTATPTGSIPDGKGGYYITLSPNDGSKSTLVHFDSNLNVIDDKLKMN